MARQRPASPITSIRRHQKFFAATNSAPGHNRHDQRDKLFLGATMSASTRVAGFNRDKQHDDWARRAALASDRPISITTPAGTRPARGVFNGAPVIAGFKSHTRLSRNERRHPTERTFSRATSVKFRREQTRRSIRI